MAMSDKELLEAAGVTDDNVKDAVDEIEQKNKKKNDASQYLHTKLQHDIGTGRKISEINADKHLADDAHLTKVGGNIFKTAEIKDGWIDVDRALLGDRNVFYPESWKFRIKPATVEAIRNWSTLDEDNPNSIDDVFNEMLKNCLAIITPTGNVGWRNICSWDRFFFILLIREYTFEQGEKKVEFTDTCPSCDEPVTFTLDSQSLMYDMPDKSVMKYYDQESRTWMIDASEFGVETDDIITLYIPTLEKEANIKAWLYSELQQNRNKKVDTTFMEFLPWMAQRISRDTTMAKKQIRQYEIQFKGWDQDEFLFMDDIRKNIIVTPKSTLVTVCPNCGEEVTSPIQFSDGISNLFAVRSKYKKFGTK